MIHAGARSLPVQHLSVRLPWHDTGWTGTVCRAPEQNICCMILNRIREARDDAAEEKVAGKSWTDLLADEWPPCREERGAAMNAKPYVLKSRHAYAKSSSLHAHFDENYFHLPAYSVSAVPFRWTRRDDARKIAQSLSLDLDLGREPKLEFDTVWIQDIDNQSVMLDTFFSAIQPRQSLVFFYAKQTPLADDPRRVLIGVGRVEALGPPQEHKYKGDLKGKLRGLMWERAVTHSIRPDGEIGFLLPYHQALAFCGERGLDPEPFVAFAPDDAFDSFSNVTEHIGHDHAIACLQILADRLRLIQKHLPGPWDMHLRWISAELTRLWELRGPFPGLASALHAFQIGYGTLLAMDLAERYAPDGRWTEDPWHLVECALAKPGEVLSPGVATQVQRMDGQRLAVLEPERRALLELLSRFRLTIEQATRFFERKTRPTALTDGERSPWDDA